MYSSYQYYTSGILHLDLAYYKLKNKMNCLILQNIPQLPHTIIADTLRIHKCLQNYELEYKEKQENGLLTLLGQTLHYVGIYCIHVLWEEVFDKLINLPFSTWVLLLLKSAASDQWTHLKA